MGGVKGREITRNGTVCMYVRGVAIVAPVDIDIDIVIPRLVCLLCLVCFVVQYCAHTVLRCCTQGNYMYPTPPHRTCCFFVDACRFRLLVAVAVAVAVVLFLSVGHVFQIANLGEEVPTRVAFLGEKEPGFPFFDQKKVPGTPGA